MQHVGGRSPTATMPVVLVGGLLLLGCAPPDDGGEPLSASPPRSPQELAALCTQDQLADRRAAKDGLSILVAAAGYEPGPLDPSRQCHR